MRAMSLGFRNHHSAPGAGRAEIGGNVLRGCGYALAYGPGLSHQRACLIVSAASLGFLALLRTVGAKAGGANVLRATLRVTFWGHWRPVSPLESPSCSELLSEATRYSTVLRYNLLPEPFCYRDNADEGGVNTW